MRPWSQAERFTVAGTGGTATFTLNYNGILSNLTIWAVSGANLTNMSAQPQVNGVNLGSAVSFVAAEAASVVYSSGGGTAENELLPLSAPAPDATSAVPHTFTFSVLLTNSHTAAEDVTLYAVGLTADL